MLAVRKSSDRGHAHHGWLDSKFTFSFADYHDPKFMGFRALRVINEDVIQGGGGFGTHGHREMEIVTYVLEGGIAHKDSIGSGGVIKPGELQHMSAGTGIRHSEFNASDLTPAHMLQIWLLPSKAGIATNRPATVATSAAASPGAIALILTSPVAAIAAKVIITPITVPSSPMNGPPAMEIVRKTRPELSE